MKVQALKRSYLEEQLQSYFRLQTKIQKNVFKIIKYYLQQLINKQCCGSVPLDVPACCKATKDQMHLNHLMDLVKQPMTTKSMKNSLKLISKLLKEDPCCV